MKKKVVALAAVLLLLILPVTAFATKPPEIKMVLVERTVLYRGLQALRLTIDAVDDLTPKWMLVVDVDTLFADFQLIKARAVYDPAVELFYYSLPVPSAAGIGTATVVVTVTDHHGLKTSVKLSIAVLDHGPVLEKRFDATKAFALAKFAVDHWSPIVNLTSPAILVEKAREKLTLAETHLFLYEDVETALTLYGEAAIFAKDALSLVVTYLGVYQVASKLKEEALIEITKARTFMLAWEAVGVDIKMPEKLLEEAEASYTLGLKLLATEGSKGASSEFAKAKVLASYAIDTLKDLIKIHLDEKKAEENLLLTYELATVRLLKATEGMAKIRSYLATLKALGVDIAGAEALLKGAEDLYHVIIAEFKVEKAPALLDAIAVLEDRLKRSELEAVAKAKETAGKLLDDVKHKYGALLGALFAPDLGHVEDMIHVAEDKIAVGDYAAAISLLHTALTELAHLSVLQDKAATSFGIGLTVIVIAAAIAVVALRPRLKRV